MATGYWYARHRSADTLTITAYASDRHPVASTVDVDTDAPEPPELRLGVVKADLSPRRVRSITVDPILTPKAPPMWYVAMAESEADPPAMVLGAFAVPLLKDGTIISTDEFERLPVRSEEQVGAVRWWIDSGLVHQIYVSPQHRRQGVGSKLFAVAYGYGQAMEWPDLHGNGELTDLGLAWVEGNYPLFSPREKPVRTRALPPMTPEHEAQGLSARLLYPD